MQLEPIHLAILVRIINMILLAYLIKFYLKSFRKIRSDFTAGLLIFSILLFAQNLFAIPFRLMLGVDYTLLDEVSLHNMVLNLLQMGGLAFIVNNTRK